MFLNISSGKILLINDNSTTSFWTSSKGLPCTSEINCEASINFSSIFRELIISDISFIEPRSDKIKLCFIFKYFLRESIVFDSSFILSKTLLKIPVFTLELRKKSSS